ncbi:MAG: hypothetical protein HY244_06830 [Rhizobiales bacterium]|nr:hypothetical protein [Hyphomicrobiales bacterium]
MRKILAVCSASAILALWAIATPATAVTPLSAGYEHAQASSQDFSARRRHRHYRSYGYRGYYGAPYYAYEPAPYYYGPRYYYGPPAPFPFWPFLW